MKKVIISILFVVFLFTACSNKSMIVSNNQEMLQIIKTEENISTDIKECCELSVDNELLMVGITGEFPQTHNYYAAHFPSAENGGYEFKGSIALIEHGWQLMGCKWQNGYVFICNNDDVVKLKIEAQKAGDEKQTTVLDVESIPWIYYMDLSELQPNYDMTFTYLDSNGNEVR